MMISPEAMRFCFGEFCLDTDRRELLRDQLPVHLTPKAFQLFRTLVERQPNGVSKESLYEQLWPGVFVEESNLFDLVSEIRTALSDDARQPRFIKTLHGFGYRFVGGVTEAAGALSPFRLRCRSREFELLEGENVLGRDLNVRVRIDAPGISRHHARITITGTRAVIEDLGSKNGTYVQGKRLDSSRELRDGDEVRLSRELLVVVAPTAIISTLTEQP